MSYFRWQMEYIIAPTSAAWLLPVPWKNPTFMATILASRKNISWLYKDLLLRDFSCFLQHSKIKTLAHLKVWVSDTLCKGKTLDCLQYGGKLCGTQHMVCFSSFKCNFLLSFVQRRRRRAIVLLETNGDVLIHAKHSKPLQAIFQMH